MTREFEACCRLLCTDLNEVTDQDNNGIKLFYDTTFALGRLYATLLTYVNPCYEGDPVMPLAVNLHERKFKSSHQIFWARIVGDLPALQKYRFPLIIDDAGEYEAPRCPESGRADYTSTLQSRLST